VYTPNNGRCLSCSATCGSWVIFMASLAFHQDREAKLSVHTPAFDWLWRGPLHRRSATFKTRANDLSMLLVNIEDAARQWSYWLPGRSPVRFLQQEDWREPPLLPRASRLKQS
jgi:hypothetical protein